MNIKKYSVFRIHVTSAERYHKYNLRTGRLTAPESYVKLLQFVKSIQNDKQLYVREKYDI